MEVVISLYIIAGILLLREVFSRGHTSLQSLPQGQYLFHEDHISFTFWISHPLETEQLFSGECKVCTHPTSNSGGGLFWLRKNTYNTYNCSPIHLPFCPIILPCSHRSVGCGLPRGGGRGGLGSVLWEIPLVWAVAPKRPIMVYLSLCNRQAMIFTPWNAHVENQWHVSLFPRGGIDWKGILVCSAGAAFAAAPPHSASSRGNYCFAPDALSKNIHLQWGWINIDILQGQLGGMLCD